MLSSKFPTATINVSFSVRQCVTITISNGLTAWVGGGLHQKINFLYAIYRTDHSAICHILALLFCRHHDSSILQYDILGPTVITGPNKQHASRGSVRQKFNNFVNSPVRTMYAWGLHRHYWMHIQRHIYIIRAKKLQCGVAGRSSKESNHIKHIHKTVCCSLKKFEPHRTHVKHSHKTVCSVSRRSSKTCETIYTVVKFE